MRIVILYDPGAADWTPEDIRGVMKAVDEIGTIFAALGHEIRKVPVRHDLRWFAVARRAELVFNLCEGTSGEARSEERAAARAQFAAPTITSPAFRTAPGPSSPTPASGNPDRPTTWAVCPSARPRFPRSSRSGWGRSRRRRGASCRARATVAWTCGWTSRGVPGSSR